MSESLPIDVTTAESSALDLSLVVPLFDEEASLEPLHQRICEAIAPRTERFEIIFVDDGSRDGSLRGRRPPDRACASSERLAA